MLDETVESIGRLGYTHEESEFLMLAAIHSGYLKGAWGEWVDTALLEQIIQEQNPKIDAGQENVPKKLVEPLPGMDLHITLLVLPQLERYEETSPRPRQPLTHRLLRAAGHRREICGREAVDVA